MLGNLRNPPEPFADVIRTHFRLKSRSLTKQLDAWLAQDDGKPLEKDGGMSAARHRGATGSSQAFRKDVEDLKAALRNLINFEDIAPASASGATPEPAAGEVETDYAEVDDGPDEVY